MSNKEELSIGADPRLARQSQAEIAKERKERAEKGPLETLRAQTQAAEAARVAEAATRAAMIANPNLTINQPELITQNTSEGERMEASEQMPIAAPEATIDTTPTIETASLPQADFVDNFTTPTTEALDDDTVLATDTPATSAPEGGNLEVENPGENASGVIFSENESSDFANEDLTQDVATESNFESSTEDTEPENIATVEDFSETEQNKKVEDQSIIETKSNTEPATSERAGNAIEELDDEQLIRLAERKIGNLQNARNEAMITLENAEQDLLARSKEDQLVDISQERAQIEQQRAKIIECNKRIDALISIIAA